MRENSKLLLAWGRGVKKTFLRNVDLAFSPCFSHCVVYNTIYAVACFWRRPKNYKVFFYTYNSQIGRPILCSLPCKFWSLQYIYILIYCSSGYIYILPLSLAPKAPSFAKTGNQYIETFYISKGFPTMY